MFQNMASKSWVWFVVWFAGMIRGYDSGAWFGVWFEEMQHACGHKFCIRHFWKHSYLRLPRLLGPLWNCERMKHTFQKIKHLPSKVLSFMKNPPNPSISNFIFQKFHVQNHPSYEQVSASAPWPRIRPKVVMRVDEMTDWLVVSTHLKKH